MTSIESELCILQEERADNHLEEEAKEGAKEGAKPEFKNIADFDLSLLA